MLTPNHYMRTYTDAQLDAIIDDPRHYGVGERLDADNLRRERRSAAIATMDATRRAIVSAAPVARPTYGDRKHADYLAYQAKFQGGDA